MDSRACRKPHAQTTADAAWGASATVTEELSLRRRNPTKPHRRHGRRLHLQLRGCTRARQSYVREPLQVAGIRRRIRKIREPEQLRRRRRGRRRTAPAGSGQLLVQAGVPEELHLLQEGKHAHEDQEMHGAGKGKGSPADYQENRRRPAAEEEPEGEGGARGGAGEGAGANVRRDGDDVPTALILHY
ncbi:hypothetical protein ACLOJK_028075 [Asimina triloba]